MNHRIVREIILRLLTRKGFDDWWFNMDQETREEIHQELESAVDKLWRDEE